MDGGTCRARPRGCGGEDGAAPSGEAGSTDGSEVVGVGAMKGAEGDMDISVFSENPGAALKFIDYVTSPEQQLTTRRPP